MNSEADIQFMQRSLALADRAKGTTTPNPSVGAVLVKNGVVIGEGATSAGGRPHAETGALAMAGGEAAGATLYVTLEPCSHYGRTPPCAKAIIDAGVERVVCAVGDPNPQVNGRGYAMLREAGIVVETGLCEDEARFLNEDFFHSVTTGLPFVTLKLAMTLDGHAADREGYSKWISSDEARTFVHDLRRRNNGIVIGSGTLSADDPELTVRLVEGRNPVRFVFSSHDSVGLGSRFRATANDIRSVVVHTGSEPAGSIARCDDGVEVWRVGARDSAPLQFLKMAAHDGMQSIFIEGGASLASSFLEAGLVNRLYVFYGPRILGGGRNGLVLSQPRLMTDALQLRNVCHRSFGDTVMVTGLLANSNEE